jgi:hypothetical protein
MSWPLDIRHDPLIRRHEPPGEVTIRRVLEAAVSVCLGAGSSAWPDKSGGIAIACAVGRWTMALMPVLSLEPSAIRLPTDP